MDWEHLPTINASRVSLRHICKDDVEALYTIFSNPEVMRYWSSPPLPDRDAATELWREIQDGLQRRAARVGNSAGCRLRADRNSNALQSSIHPPQS